MLYVYLSFTLNWVADFFRNDLPPRRPWHTPTLLKFALCRQRWAGATQHLNHESAARNALCYPFSTRFRSLDVVIGATLGSTQPGLVDFDCE